MVHGRHVVHLAVLPRSVGETDYPVIVCLGLLVAVQRIEVAGIALLDVGRVGILQQGHATQSCIHTRLQGRAVLGCSLCGLRSHHLVLLILGEHGGGVFLPHQVVVECLSVVVVGCPACETVEVDVGFRAVKLYLHVAVGKLPGIVVGRSCLVAVHIYLDTADAAVWGYARRLYHDVKACLLVGGIQGYGGLLCAQVVGVGCGRSVAGEHEFLARQVETEGVVAKAVDKACRAVFHVLHLDRKTECHTVLLDAAVVERLVRAHGFHVFCYAQSHAAFVVLRAVGGCTVGVLHKSVARPVAAFYGDFHIAVLYGLVGLAVAA